MWIILLYPMQYDICTLRTLFDRVKDGLHGLCEIWKLRQNFHAILTKYILYPVDKNIKI